MKRILIIAGSIFALLLVAVIALPFLIPSSVYKNQIESAATKALGREVILIGDPSLSIFPSISAKIDGAQVANPDGFTDALMIEAGQLKANVKLWPLFSQKVEISEISLSDATVRLEKLIDGRSNWEFPAPEETDTSNQPDDTKGGFQTGIARAGLTNAAVYFADRQTGQQFALTDFNTTARLTALDKPFTSEGDGRINGQVFKYDISLETIDSLTSNAPSALTIELGTDYGDITYDGFLSLGDIPQLDGSFTVASTTIGQVLAVIGDVDLPIKANELKSIAAKGTIKGPIDTALLNFSEAKLKATGLDFEYAGEITLGAQPILDGAITLNASDAQRLFKAGQPMIGPLSILGNVDLIAKVKGPSATPTLTGITLKQRAPNLITDYTGSIDLGGQQALNGDLAISSQNLRPLLAALDVKLPEGDTLQNVAVKGNVSGELLAPMLSGATLTLDDTSATGQVGANLKGATPRLVADLSMETLDLTPFLGASAAESDAPADINQDWDDSPLALDGLKAVNATITIAAGNVILDNIELSDALLKTRLDDGRLSAIFRNDDNKPGFKAFDGNWSGDLVLDASRSTPTLKVDALADSVAAQKLLGDLTGFNRLSGLGDVRLDLSSEGNSLKGLISGLDGKFESNLSNGALKGINLAQLIRSADNLGEAVKSGNLTLASFKDVISSDAETDFSSFLGNLTFDSGVATLSEVRLNNPVLTATASGKIDLAARTIDIRFTPRVDRQAQGAGSTIGLSGIPVPIRISGPWTKPSYGFDTDAVRTELTARARGTVADTIRDRVGGDVGGIIGDIVGGQRGSTPAPAAPTDDAEEAAPVEEKSIEDELKDRAVEGALGAIFGGKKNDDTED